MEWNGSQKPEWNGTKSRFSVRAHADFFVAAAVDEVVTLEAATPTAAASRDTARNYHVRRHLCSVASARPPTEEVFVPPARRGTSVRGRSRCTSNGRLIPCGRAHGEPPAPTARKCVRVAPGYWVGRTPCRRPSVQRLRPARIGPVRGAQPGCKVEGGLDSDEGLVRWRRQDCRR